MAGNVCDVCGGESIGVASSSLGAISFAYCQRCVQSGAEPYGFLIISASMVNARTIDDLADWFKPVVYATLEASGNTLKDFHADLKAQNDHFDQEMLMWEEAEKLEDLEDLEDYEDDPFFK